MTQKNEILLNKNADQEKIIDQYKILTDSINTNNQLRESANNFWVTVNSLGLSTIAYIKDNTNLSSDKRPFIIWILVFVGIILCCSWLSYLRTIKKTIDQRYSLLFIME